MQRVLGLMLVLGLSHACKTPESESYASAEEEIPLLSSAANEGDLLTLSNTSAAEMFTRMKAPTKRVRNGQSKFLSGEFAISCTRVINNALKRPTATNTCQITDVLSLDKNAGTDFYENFMVREESPNPTTKTKRYSGPVEIFCIDSVDDSRPSTKLNHCSITRTVKADSTILLNLSGEAGFRIYSAMGVEEINKAEKTFRGEARILCQVSGRIPEGSIGIAAPQFACQVEAKAKDKYRLILNVKDVSAEEFYLTLNVKEEKDRKNYSGRIQFTCKKESPSVKTADCKIKKD